MHRPDHPYQPAGQYSNPLDIQGETFSNPTNPNRYNFQWGSNTINNYLDPNNTFQNPYTFGEGGTDSRIDFLDSLGIKVEDLDESSLAFLPSMDRLQTAYDRMNTGIGMFRTGLGFDMDASQHQGAQNLLDMTGGQGLTSLPSGFGAAQDTLTSNVGRADLGYTSGLERSMADFQSNILGSQYDYQDSITDFQDTLTTALGNIAAAGEDDFTVNVYDPNNPSTPNYNEQQQGYGPTGAPANPYPNQIYMDSSGTQWRWDDVNGIWT